ncbi:MAG: right-handed parallel beta-helix repeat-containing protein, partial [Bacteroidales bacterium]|nr:right-handed parallel beta-helix repeat-containing protein [Bacteroidales bacterium]
MKKLIILISFVLIGITIEAQIIKYSENFETLPLTVTSSGSSAWSRSSTLQYSGTYSDSANIINNGDSAILITDAIDISGFSNILLDFQHICKTEFFDGGYIEFSNDNGISWTRLNGATYIGNGLFGNIGNKFSSFSYAIDWDATNNGTIPNNTWWKHEQFDLSTFAGNHTQVKLKFVYKDDNNTGGVGTYGWLLDDIKLVVSNSELNPPQITLNNPILKDSVDGTGPFAVSAQITDLNGIDTAMLEYTIAGITDTVGMVNTTGNTYIGSIPSQIYGTNICYKVIAIDASNNHNINSTNCNTFFNRKPDITVTIGSGTSSSYTTPIYNGTTTDSRNRSSHISIVKASELAGYYGYISNLSLFKNDNNGYGMSDAHFSIYLKHTNLNVLPSDSSTFYSEFTGATLVYNSTTDSIPSIAGKLGFELNLSNFNYNGQSNLMIMIEWYRPSTLPQNFINFLYDFEAGLANTLYGSVYRSAEFSSAGRRPKMELLFTRYAVDFDVTMDTIISPQPVILGGNNPVKIRLKNTGDSTLVKATVNWEVNNVLQPSYIWNGSLEYGLSTLDLNIGSYNFITGPHKVKVWAQSPNDNTDEQAANDTITVDIYSCDNILNGIYTVGGQYADFATIEDASTALSNCGISGPTTIALNDGIYDTQLILDNNIPGHDSVNTLTITSVSGNASNVIIEHHTAAAFYPFVIGLDNIEYLTIKDITIKSLDPIASSAIKFINGSSHITIDGCIIETVIGDYNNIFPILMADGNVHDNTVINSKLIGGYYSIKVIGKNTSVDKNIRIINNEIVDFQRYGIYFYYAAGSDIIGNYYSNYYEPSYYSSIVSIYVYYSDNVTIEGNESVITTDNNSYGIYLYNSNGTLAAPIKFVNNISIVKGSSSATSYNACYIYNSSYIDIINNTFVAYSGSAVTSAFYISNNGKTGLNIINNIFSSMGGALSMKTISGLVSINNMDYNSYYSTGSGLAKFDNTDAFSSTGIAGIRIATLMDTNSLVTTPLLYSIDNGRSYSSTLESAATPFAGVTHDIDGRLRSTISPSIGASEFSVSSIDAGVVTLINPLAIDTQNRVTDIDVIIKNYGTGNVTSMDVKYSLNGGAPITYSWTGNLATTESDTVSIPSFTIPVINYTLDVYTVLTGDTNTYNDSASFNYYGLPLIEAAVLSLENPLDGCDKSAEIIKIKIENNGLQDITSGLTASYQILGNPNVYTESVNDTILVGSSIIFEFSQTADMTPIAVDSIYSFILSINHTSDPLGINDTLIATALSMAPLQSPIISDTTINYGDVVTLVASSIYPIEWFANDTTDIILESSSSYTTPMLYDTTQYWLQGNTNIPPSESQVGGAQNTYGGWDKAIYGGGMSVGRYQIVYTAAELLSGGLIPGEINSIAFATASAFSAPQSGFEIKLAHTGVSTLTSSFEIATFTTVYNTTFTGVAGWNIHQFSTPFVWDGTSNILVDICATAISYGSVPVYYTATTGNTYLAISGFGTSCASPTGTASNKRPNVKFTTTSTLGCSSLRAFMTVNVPLPQFDGSIEQIIAPIDNCGIEQAEVIIAIVNKGTDTLASGFTATYRINNGAFITPEVVNSSINPGDTLEFSFSNLANLNPGIGGLKYVIGAKINIASDTYSPNDTLNSDSILSKYTPINPVVTGQTISYAQTATINGAALDTLFWYSDSIANHLLALGNPFITAPLYDTTTFWVASQRYSTDSNYQIGNGTSVNINNEPSPYGSNSLGARHQFLIKASELRDMGVMQGYIKNVAFDVSVVKANPLNSFTIKIGTTSYNNLAVTLFDTTLTTVYGPTTYIDSYGWNTHNFSTPYYWDGISNLIIETCFKGNALAPFAGVKSITTPFVSSAQSLGSITFSCQNNYTSTTYSQRPNIKIKQEGFGLCKSDILPVIINVNSFPAVDASILSIGSLGDNISSCTTYPIKAIIKNYGSNTMTSANINWSENGINQSSYSWSGSLAIGDIDTVIIAPSHSFGGGLTEIKAWITQANDNYAINDTALIIENISLSGDYSIGALNGKYPSFGAAIADLNLCGMCGPVVFNVDSATYIEQIELSNIDGNNSTNSITFKSASDDSTTVNLIYNTVQNSNYIVLLRDIENVIFKDMTFTAAGGQYGNVFVFRNNVSNILIKNNAIISTNTTVNNSIASAIYCDNYQINSLTIDNNRIINGYKAVYFKQSTNGNITDINITNNTIESYINYGIYIYRVDSLTITNNTISDAGIYSTVYGIYGYYLREGLNISNNIITQTATSASLGIYLNAEYSASNRGLISNNSIASITGMGSQYGIYLSSCKYLDVFYNSINIPSVSNSSTKAFNIYNGNDLKIKNNNIYTESGYAFYINNSSAISELDYNNYKTGLNSLNYVGWVGANIADITAFKNIDLTKNVNSLEVDPVYYSNTNLQSMQLDLYNAGTPISTVTTDINGNVRGSAATSIGAYEFTPPAIDLSAEELIYPYENSCDLQANDSIVVMIKNYGLNNIDFSATPATITIEIDGINPDTIVYTINTGGLASGVASNYTVATNYNLSTNGEYIINIYTTLSGDGNLMNNAIDEVVIIKYPIISSFPFNEDFESGINISFKPESDINSNITVSTFAGNNSTKGLHFEGGTYSDWISSSNVDVVFNNTTHVAKAYSCNIDASSVNHLNIKFDLKQTANSSSSISNASWFRLMITTTNGTHYLTNLNGDSVFHPFTTGQDPFTNQIFSLDNYIGQIFSISFEAVNKYKYGYSGGSGLGDNVLIDNIYLWEPIAIDLGINSIVQGENFGPIGTVADVNIAIENFGLDTLYNIPLAYRINNGTIIRDTFMGSFAPNESDTFTFAQSFNLTTGTIIVTAFNEYVGDAVTQNDTATAYYKGMKTVITNYSDNFEGNDDWMPQGSFGQWELGMPNTANLDTTHSGINAWVTRLNTDYNNLATEYLYTPYITIPAYTDTVTVSFWHKMRMVANKAYSALEYSFDGTTWAAIGYIGIPTATNWYNTVISGQHVWSKSDNNWLNSTIKLDPATFNTGNPVQFRFKFVSLFSPSSDEGWAIDDF